MSILAATILTTIAAIWIWIALTPKRPDAFNTFMGLFGGFWLLYIVAKWSLA